MKKVERQYLDIAGASGEPLRVNETTVEAYFRRFQWDHAVYQHQGKHLTEIVAQIQAMVTKVDEDLKTLSTTYTEKSLTETNAIRKRTVNLMTSDFEDFLKPEDVAKMDPIDTENMLTVAVVVPKALEQGMKILNIFESRISSFF